MTLPVSAADQRALVFRDGVEVGRARIVIDDPGVPLGTHAFVALATGTPGAARAHCENTTGSKHTVLSGGAPVES